MDSSCVANNSYLFVTVMLTKLILITIKCYILNTTPFDLIIGRNTIKKHHLVNRFPAYFGAILEPTDITPIESGGAPPVLCQATKQKKVKSKTKKSTCCTGICSCTPGKTLIATGPNKPDSPKLPQALPLKRRREPPEPIPHTLTAVQSFFLDHDGVPLKRSAALERTYLCAGTIKTKEELLGPATTDDEEDDEISDMIDTFRYFTEKPSEENYLDLLTYGKDVELNKEIRALCAEFPQIFSGTLPKTPARLAPFRIEVDRSAWEINKNQLPPRVQTPVKNTEILKQVTELLNLGIIEHSNASHYSQCLLAPKPHTNKTEWRFCIDYRWLNDLTASLSWPLPNIKQMFERLGAQKAKYFAVMDFTQGFLLISSWILYTFMINIIFYVVTSLFICCALVSQCILCTKLLVR